MSNVSYAYLTKRIISFQDYDTEDLAEFKKVLLDTCDTNRDGKINKEELTMVLMAFNRPSVLYDEPVVLDE